MTTDDLDRDRVYVISALEDLDRFVNGAPGDIEYALASAKDDGETDLSSGDATAGGDLNADDRRAIDSKSPSDAVDSRVGSVDGGNRFQSWVGVSGRLSALRNSWSSTVLTTLGKGLPTRGGKSSIPNSANIAGS